MKLGDWALLVAHAACVGVLIAALSAAACDPQLQGPLCPAPVASSPCEPRATWQLYAIGFDAEELLQLRDAAAMWEATSGGAVRFEWLQAPATDAVSIAKGPIVEANVPGAMPGALLGITRYGRHAVTIDADAIPPNVGLTGVAAHELGHVMGLVHSPNLGALMAPSVHDCMRVTDDDLRALYEVLQ